MCSAYVCIRYVGSVGLIIEGLYDETLVLETTRIEMQKRNVALALVLLIAAVAAPQITLAKRPSYYWQPQPNQTPSPESRVQETATSIIATEEGGGGLVDGYAEAAWNNQGYDAQLLFTDSNGKAAMALASLVEQTDSQFMVVNGSRSVNLDDKIKVALNFIARAQNDAKNFHYAYDYVNHIWYDPPPYQFGYTNLTELDWWNAYILASLAFVSAKMRMSAALSEQDRMSYDNFKTLAETCIDAWRSRSQQFDGSWAFTYSYEDDSGVHLRQDTAIDTNGMMLIALISLARLESSEGNSNKAADYAAAAGRTAVWLLARQELNPANQWAYGGFYNSAGSRTLYLDANARATIGLVYFALSVDTLALSRFATKEQLTQHLVLWADQFVSRNHDSWWGPYWKRDVSGLGNGGYPKFTYSAAELGLAMTGISMLDSDPKYQGLSTNFYAWYTGKNEFGIDFQFVLPKRRMYAYLPIPRAFSLGIDFNASRILVVWPDSNLETNAEVLQHLLALVQPAATWSLPESSSSQPQQQRCVIATAAFGSELAAPVQFLREFRDEEVQRTVLGAAFLRAFNGWYYSWAPAVAGFEAGSDILRGIVRVVIMPLIGMLYLGHEVFHALRGLNPEVAILVSGLLASSLIGLVYLTLPFVAAAYLTRRRLTGRSLAWIAVVGIALGLFAALSTGTFGFLENLTAILVIEALVMAPAAFLVLLQRSSCESLISKLLDSSVIVQFASLRLAIPTRTPNLT